jgi:hypothetical protein
MSAAADLVSERRRKKRRLLIGVGLLLAIVAVGLVALRRAVWVASERTPPPVPSPNAYDDLLGAARALQAAGFPESGVLDVEHGDATALRAALGPHHEALAAIHRAVEPERPFQVPYIYDWDDLHTRLRDELRQVDGFAVRGLLAEGELARREGRVDDALLSYLDLLRLGHATGRRVPSYPFQFSQRPWYYGLRGLRDLHAALSAEQCRSLIAILAELERKREPTAAVARREQAFLEAVVPKQLRLTVWGEWFFWLSGRLRQQGASAGPVLEFYEKQAVALHRLLIADLAVRLYRFEHGADPESLDVLVPAILPAVPVDPYSGRPLLYYKDTPGGSRPYSTGPDRDDDHLQPVLGRQFTETTNGDFSLDTP